ncbi:MAG: hypothetical protein J6S85_09950 [Methanobrevibacter sp.]|nr:hypothetical protein [Methanobrevibacter sp.]
MVGTQTNTFPNVSSTWANSITYFFVVKPNTTYTYSCSTVGDRLGIFGLNSIVNPNNYTTQSSLQFDTKFFSAGTSAPTELSYTFTTTADTKMVAIYCALNTPPTNIQIEVGSQATAYVNFQDGINVEGTTETVTDSRGFTATCQYLLGIDDDTDTQEIISGTVTRNIGYKIFDGTESFGSSSAYGTALYINAASAYWGANRNKAVLCTYFLGKSTAQSQQPLYTCFFNSSGHFYFRTTETATDFKTWLAEQYANGTPLILFFVKSTATTESVT